jgi:protein CWC15
VQQEGGGSGSSSSSSGGGGGDSNTKFGAKRRWNDDVVFKNQAKDVAEKKPKRFINDTIRSDFHRSFLHKFMK